MKSIKCGWTTVVAIAWIGCGGSHELEPSAQLQKIFADFTFVRRQALTDELKPGFQPVATTMVLEAFEPGYRYIFHRRQPGDDVGLGVKTLPERLSSQGFEVVESPKTERDLIYSYKGGPFFRIRFRFKNRTGVIFNVNDPVIDQDETLRRDWVPSAYILELQP